MKSFARRNYKKRNISFAGRGYKTKGVEIISFVDTANKRYSMFGLFLPGVIVFPVPDGSNFATKAERIHLNQGYAGITP